MSKVLHASKWIVPNCLQYTTEITELLAPVKKRSLAFEFLFRSRDHLERPFGHVTFPSHRLSQQRFTAFTAQIRAQIIMKAYGRTFEHGKSIEKVRRESHMTKRGTLNGHVNERLVSDRFFHRCQQFSDFNWVA